MAKLEDSPLSGGGSVLASAVADRAQRGSNPRPAARAEKPGFQAPQAPPRYYANNCSGSADTGVRWRRWEGLRLLWTLSNHERIRKCRRTPITTNHVELRIRPAEQRAHYSLISTCGSVWECPCCSVKILTKRAEELQTAIEAHVGRGGRVAMVTLTMRHDRGQALGDLWAALGQAWRAATSSTSAARAVLDGIDWVRKVEVTHGAHGWHVHVHALLFVAADVDQVQVEAIGDAMFVRWAARLVRAGMAAPLRDRGGLKAQLLTLDAARAEIAGYLAKGTYGESVRDAALELAGPGKGGRRAGRTPFQILEDLQENGLGSDLALWREWEVACWRKRAFTWRDGAKLRLVGDAEEATDEELAEETDRGGVLVATFPGKAWARIVCVPGLPVRILEWAENAGEELALRVINHNLARRGLPPAHAPPAWSRR